MNQRIRLTLGFASAGFIAVAVCTFALWELFHGPKYIDMVLGTYRPRYLFAFPFVAAVLAAGAVFFFDPTRFGALQGALVAAFALAGFCTLLTALRGDGFSRLGAFTLAAFVFFGWALVPVGAVTGWFYKRRVCVAL